MSESNAIAQYTSTGHRLGNIEFIDAHYAVCRTSYEAMLRAVGIQPGWHVLDAGCGSGSFLPLMAELVGPTGQISAYDLAPENIERVHSIARQISTPIKTQIGDLTNLPYADHTFDAVWNANVTQYLTDDEMTHMLKEFARILKPSGLVAIKESDVTMLQFHPFDRFVYWRYLEQETHVQPGFLRVPNLPGWLKRAGFVDVRQSTFIEEIRAPLPKYVHDFMAGSLQFFAKEAEGFQLSDSDMAHWRRCREPNGLDNPVNDPDFYFREGMTLVVGVNVVERA